MPSRLGIDVGGTHTDILLLDDVTGRTHVLKTPATPKDPAVSVVRGLAELMRAAGVRSADIVELVHATSMPAALASLRDRPAMGLLVTRGFEQMLHPDRSHAHRRERQALVEPAMTRGVAERMSARGDAIAPLDEALARGAIEELLGAGAQTLVICLQHAAINPAHELQLKAIIRDIDPQIPVALSHELTQESGENERALATVANAYLQPGMSRYLDSLREKLQGAQLNPRISFVQSTGARAGVAHAVEAPVHTLLAGAAAGAMGAAHVASHAGYPDALSLDMGGTSAHVCLIRDGAARLSGRTALDHDAYLGPMNLPAVDVRRIGPGTCALARTPMPGALRIGSPGPREIPGALRGGDAPVGPSVRDANVVLGRFGPTLAPSTVQAAREAVASLARELSLDEHRTAEGIIEIANENMAGALRRTALERGLDPARLALIAFGGAGPMHGCEVGMLAGCTPVIVPRHAGVLSAHACLWSPYSFQYAQSVGRRLDELTPSGLGEIIDRLSAQASAWLASEAPDREGKIRFRADLGYLRGAFQISAALDRAAVTKNGLSSLAGQLDEAHRHRFGFKRDDPIQLITIRAIATAPAESYALPRFQRAGADATSARVHQTQTYFDGAFVNTPVYERDRLLAGNRIAGPAIVTQADATTVVHPSYLAEVDEHLNLIIRPHST